MTLLTSAFAQGTHAARAAASASNQGFYYFETDTLTLFQSTGSAWVQLAPAATVTGGGATTYRKVTSKTVSGTVTETDLLNGEITLAAGVLGTTKIATIDLWGDYKQNIANNTALPVLKLKLGSTVLFQWQPFLSLVQSASSTNRYGWSYRAIIANANAANAQTATISGMWAGTTSSTGSPGANGTSIATGEGCHSVVYTAGGGSALEYLSGYNTAAVDTTSAQALTLTATNGTASTPYDITLDGCLVTVL